MARLVTKEEIIGRFKKAHGDRYDYGLVDYRRYNEKVRIICKDHGEFMQTPSNHLAGKGCIICGYKSQSKVKTKTTEEFIKEAKTIHGDKYDYSKVVYKHGKHNVVIICKEHGEFLQSPNNHTHAGTGKGCPRCGEIRGGDKIKMTTSDFIEKSIKVHGNKYDYSKTIYERNNIELGIICYTHGMFYQKPSNHLSGNGCHQCGIISSKKQKQYNPTGWSITNWNDAAKRSKNFDSFKVYVIKCTGNGESFYKIGRTFKTVVKRFEKSKYMPYNYTIIKEFTFTDAKSAFNKEVELKALNNDYRHLPLIEFYGMHECFSHVKYDK